MKKYIAMLLALSLLAISLIGCSGDKGEKTTESTNNKSSTKQDLIIAVDSDISTLHPSDYATTVEHDINKQIYDKLMVIKNNNGAVSYEPRLAKSWDVSEDGTVYTFYLQEGVTFHDGSPFTAEDVKFTLDLYAQSNYQGASVDGISNITILDDNTIQITTDGVFSPFIENIERVLIGSKAYHESSKPEEFANLPIGTGPYKFVEHNIGSNIILEANDDYFLGEPQIKNVNFRVITDKVTTAISMQTKEVDFVKLAESNYEMLKDIEGITIANVPSSRFGFISLNHEKEPYSNPKFRQAVAYAIDRQNLIDLALDGIGTVNSNIISPLRFGYAADLPVYDYNPEKAKELLEEIGIVTPYDLGVMPVAEQYNTQAQVIQNDLAAVGLNVQIEIVEFNSLLGQMFNGDVGITTLAMVLDGSTQQYCLALTSKYVGAANNGRYSNPEIDQLFKDAEKTIDEKERESIYHTIFTKVQEDTAYVILYNNEILYAYNDQLYVPEIGLEGYFYIYEFQWN